MTKLSPGDKGPETDIDKVGNMWWRQGKAGRAPFLQNDLYLFTDVWNLLKRKMIILSYRHRIKMQVTLGPLMEVKDHTNDLYKILKVDGGRTSIKDLRDWGG